MLKIKIFGSLLTGLLLLLGLFSVPTYAVSPSVSIQKLPGYINNNSFPLSCSVLNGTTAQFYVSKHGGAYTAFGPSINLNTSVCKVSVTGSQVSEQTDYSFQVSIDAGAATDTTSTIYDTNGPSNVSNYSKEFVIYGFNKIHWRNPSDSDFSQAVIYRGNTYGFEADGSHEIARVSGAPDVDMTYDDHFSYEINKNYYYLIRALDKAGNSSGLVGDNTTVQGTPGPQVAGASTSTTGGGKVTRLPKEEGGQVLGKETVSPTSSMEPSPSGAGAVESGAQNPAGLLSWPLTHKKISLLIILVLAGLGYLLLKRK